MRRLRTASTRRLITIVAVLVAAVAGAGIAQAALNSAPKPAPKPAGPGGLGGAPRQARGGRDGADQVHEQVAAERLAATGHGLADAHRRHRPAVAEQRRPGAAGAAVRRG